MGSIATFLHVTDAHLAEAGTAFARDDHKVSIPGIGLDQREAVLDLLFQRLAEQLSTERRHLDGILFSGDAQDRGRPGGHELLLAMLLKHFGPLGIMASKIVATPGNHDVPRDTAPGSAARYAPFNSIWRAAGCIVPWLDGVDPARSAHHEDHRLLDAERRWVVYPINSSNWSHVTFDLQEPLRSAWDTIPRLFAH
jgi:hypothetical protein